MTSSWRRYRTLASYCWRADPWRFGAYWVIAALLRILPFVAAFFARQTIVAALNGNPGNARTQAVLVGLSTAAVFLDSRAMNRLAATISEKSTELYDRDLIRLSAEVAGIEHLENPEFLDTLEQIRHQPGGLGLNGPGVTLVLWAVLQTVIVLALLLTVDPLLLLLLPFAGVSAWASHRGRSLMFRAFAAGSPSRRTADHFFTLGTAPARADEVRALGIQDEVIRRHDAAWAAADLIQAEAERRATLLITLGAVLSTAAYAGTVTYVVARGLQGKLSAGDVVLTVLVAGLISVQITNMRDSVARLLSAMAMVDRFLWLVDHVAQTAARSQGGPAPTRLTDGITLRGVSFTYPGTQQQVLSEIDLNLAAGSTVAVVGENGAGKTTLVKLLTAMYEPTTGVVAVDGVDLATVDAQDWRRRTSAAFQDFARLEFTLGESVGVGDITRLSDDDHVLAALDRAGAGDLPTQLDQALATELGPSFQAGRQLSGGQWQKVALGRAMMREQPLLLIFDEPTASLDPGAEQQLYTQYTAQARRTATANGSITILVSHRLATVRHADQIIVLDNGRITEAGTHAELIASGGAYAELFELQARNFRGQAPISAATVPEPR